MLEKSDNCRFLEQNTLLLTALNHGKLTSLMIKVNLTGENPTQPSADTNHHHGSRLNHGKAKVPPSTLYHPGKLQFGKIKVADPFSHTVGWKASMERA